MRIIVTMAVVLASLSACGGGNIEDDSRVSVFKSAGGIQCGDKGLSLTTMQGQLTAAKVEVRSAACGGDGRMYAAVCGAPDGRIGIFQIPAAQVSAAAAAGFAPLRTLPDAQVVPCV